MLNQDINIKNSFHVSQSKITNYCNYFNKCDDEFIKQYIPNETAADFLNENCPLLDCPDKMLELMYYFRWWSFRKHIKNTDDGFVISEFLPKVHWAKKHNTIVCASGFHIMEARWLKNKKYAEDYLKFWYGAGRDGLDDYTSWLPYASLRLADVTGNTDLMSELHSDFVNDINQFYKGEVTAYYGDKIHYDDNGMFYCFDFYDGGEISVGGDGYRPLFNSAMYANVKAVSDISRAVGDKENEEIFIKRAIRLKNAVQERLWNKENQFFTVLDSDNKLKNVRELYGYSLWFFGLADEGFAECFNYLFDKRIFSAPYGLTFTEQCNKEFSLNYSGHECQWNGPVWPMATSFVLGAMENLINNYKQHNISGRDYYDLLHNYVTSQLIVHDNGVLMPWIDENINPYTGDWISRTRLKKWENGSWCDGKGGYERGKNYNHSMFCNHVISGLLGIRPDTSGLLTINPLVETIQWPWFCMENINCHGKNVMIMWDSDGQHYNTFKGFSVWVNDKCVFTSLSIEKVTINLKSEELI